MKYLLFSPSLTLLNFDWPAVPEKNFSLFFPYCLVRWLILSPDESRGYLGFSTVTPPPQRFPFGRDNLKNILVRTFKFGMWVYMGNVTNAIVL